MVVIERDLKIVSSETAQFNFPPEPAVIVISQDGKGELTRNTVTLREFEESIKKFAVKKRELNQRREVWKRKKFTSHGKRYSSSERKAVSSELAKEEQVNQQQAGRLLDLSEWLIKSPGEKPLSVLIEKDGKAKIIEGSPLEENEAAWRLFVIKCAPEVSQHPNLGIVREYFLRRRKALETDKTPEALSELERFQREIANALFFPEELVPVMAKITEHDFRRPLLPVLEILEQLRR